MQPSISAIYLTPAAVSSFTQLILSVLAGGYFVFRLSRSSNKPSAWWGMGLMVCLSALLAGSFLLAALLSTSQQLKVNFVLSTLLGATLLCGLQFAYHFPELHPQRRWEAHLVLIVSTLYTLVEAGYAIYRFAMLQSGEVLYRPNGADYILLAFFLWAPLVFLRQAKVIDAKYRRTLHQFALIFLLSAALNLLTILRSEYIIPVWMANLFQSLGLLGVIFAFVLNYLTAPEEQTSIVIKIIGGGLVALLGLLGVISWALNPLIENSYQPVLPDQKNFRFIPQADGYAIAEMPYKFDSDLGTKLALLERETDNSQCAAIQFKFVFFNQSYSRVYVCNDGSIAMLHPARYRSYQYYYGATQPIILPLLIDLNPEVGPGAVFARQQAGQLTLTWQDMPAFVHSEEQYTFQVVLYSDGSFEFRYKNLPDNLHYYANASPGASPWVIGILPGAGAESNPQYVLFGQLPLHSGSQGMIQDYQSEFRRSIHTFYFPLFILILVASVGIIIVFPALLYPGLVTPLRALLRAVRRIDAGNYAEPVAIGTGDEIGSIAQTFNKMMGDLQTLIQTLEERVKDRTVELSQANDQLLHEIHNRDALQSQVIEQQRSLASLEERERMSRQLHDGIGQVMGYINIQSQVIQTLLKDGQNQAAVNSLERMKYHAQQAHNELRLFILGLRTPSETLDKDLVATLVDYVETFRADTGLAVCLNLPPSEEFPNLAPAVEEQILHILREALNNTYKHAQAKQIEILFCLNNEGNKPTVEIIISDDGIGFDVNCTNLGSNHFGLGIMRERAEKIGARLEIRSTPGFGSKVILTIPILHGLDKVSAQSWQGLRVLLVDDSAIFTEGLSTLLSTRGAVVVGSARNGREAVEKAHLLRPDVVVMDLVMPEMDGLEATRRLKTDFPELKILILTASVKEEHLLEAIRSGAAGFLLKDMDANEFCACLARLAAGETILPAELASRLLSRPALSPQILPDTEMPALLSARQQQILDMVALGMTYKEVGAALHLSEKSIKYYMAQILDHLHLENRAQAIAFARSRAAKT